MSNLGRASFFFSFHISLINMKYRNQTKTILAQMTVLFVSAITNYFLKFVNFLPSAKCIFLLSKTPIRAADGSTKFKVFENHLTLSFPCML